MASASASATATRLPILSCTWHHPYWPSYYNTSIITKSEFNDFIMDFTVQHQNFFLITSASASATATRLPIPSCTRHRHHWSSHYHTSIITRSEFTEFIVHVTAQHQDFFPVASALASATRLPSQSRTQHYPQWSSYYNTSIII